MPGIKSATIALLLCSFPLAGACQADDDKPKAAENEQGPAPKSRVEITSEDGQLKVSADRIELKNPPGSAPAAVERTQPEGLRIDLPFFPKGTRLPIGFGAGTFLTGEAKGSEGRLHFSVDFLSLEQLIADAMSHRPEVRLAEAKVKEAEAELAKVRLEITKEVLAFNESLDDLRAKASTARETILALEKKQTEGVTAGRGGQIEKELAGQRSTLKEVERELKKAEQTISFLTGSRDIGQQFTRVYPLVELEPEVVTIVSEAIRDPFEKSNVQFFEPNKSMVLTASERLHDRTKRILSAYRKQRPARGSAGAQATVARQEMAPSYVATEVDNRASTFANKIAEAAKQEVDLEFEENSILNIMEHLHQKTGLNFLASPELETMMPITLSIKKVPLWAAAQAIEDSTGMRFIVREYGILVTQLSSVDGPSLTQFIAQRTSFGLQQPTPAVPRAPTTPESKAEAPVSGYQPKK